MAAIDICSIRKSFGTTDVLRDVSLAIGSGEFVAVLGPSGCGKTTLLRCIAGFERLNAGEIRIDHQPVSSPDHHMPPEDRGIGVVFQNYALWPHMSVADNVSYGLKIRGLSRQIRTQRTREVLDIVGLGPLAKRRPADLSGGQRQRVALARCLAMEAQVVLLDEPLANLDVHLRGALEEEFSAFHRRSGATMFYITHDQAEALAMADRVAVMFEGQIVQFATPRTLFREPASERVATFIGNGAVLDVENLSPLGDGRARATFLGQPITVRCPARQTARPSARIAFHPGDWDLTGEQGHPGGIPARVTRTTYRGGLMHTDLATGPNGDISLSLSVPDHSAPENGDQVSLSLRDGWVLPDPAPSPVLS